MNIFRVVPYLFPLLIEALIGLRLPFLGRILSIFQRPISDDEALRQLNRAQEWRPKRKSGFNDSAHVIKVSDAIKCLQTQTNSRLHWLAVAKEVAKSLVGTPANSMAALSDAVVECLRSKALSQSSERTYEKTKTGYHRPSLGHGKGRL